MTSLTLVATKRADVAAAMVLLLLAEATLFFTFLFVIGPIAPLERMLPLVAVLALCAALHRGREWARWGLLVPIAFRVWRLVLLVAAAWALGRAGVALFLACIILAELSAVLILVDTYVVRRKASPV